MNDIIAYYDELSTRYDADRFGNSYGRMVDAEERTILRRWLAPHAGGRVIDLGCGSGRFLDLATEGIDPSAGMVGVARAKFPGITVHHGSLADMPEGDVPIAAIFSMHVFMHLPLEEVRSIIGHAARLLRPGGSFIFDAPSALRRRLTGHRQEGWHGATALSPRDVLDLAGNGWRLKARRGILTLPVHRIPDRLRPAVRAADMMIGRSVIKDMASYTIFHLERAR
ncbi:MAG: SAM-dependent methyltransferase [Chlorobi bacterium]|nr:SAM-dependent methyltransferase [Chlorobiota bacterium]